MLLEVLDAVLPEPALSAADQPLDEVLRFLGDVRDVRRELEPLLGVGGSGRRVLGRAGTTGRADAARAARRTSRRPSENQRQRHGAPDGLRGSRGSCWLCGCYHAAYELSDDNPPIEAAEDADGTQGVGTAAGAASRRALPAPTAIPLFRTHSRETVADA